VWVVAPLVWHGARARAELVRLGMRPADAAVTERLRRHAADLSHRADGSVPAIRDVVHTFVAAGAAEDARADGRPAADAWADVVRRWEALAQPYPAAYAAMRRAEAELAARTRSAAGAGALRRAERAAAAMGAVPLLTEIRELAAYARVALQDPTPRDPTPRDPSSTRDPSAVPAPRAASDLPAPDLRTPGLRAPGPCGAATSAADPLHPLTVREREVLGVLAEGLTNREIAGRLFIAEKTVDVHVGRIYSKLNVRGRVQATSLFRRAHPDRRGGAPD
jgi:DNA-binding CsgD family transcriptional regulator